MTNWISVKFAQCKAAKDCISDAIYIRRTRRYHPNRQHCIFKLCKAAGYEAGGRGDLPNKLPLVFAMHADRVHAIGRTAGVGYSLLGKKSLRRESQGNVRPPIPR